MVEQNPFGDTIESYHLLEKAVKVKTQCHVCGHYNARGYSNGDPRQMETETPDGSCYTEYIAFKRKCRECGNRTYVQTSKTYNRVDRTTTDWLTPVLITREAYYAHPTPVCTAAKGGSVRVVSDWTLKCARGNVSSRYALDGS